jgi:glycosyltransferase involved in cell wall biosynthesis
MIPNGIVPELFTRPDSAKRDIDILGVGTFEPLKQYDLFPEIIKFLKSDLPGIKACHCGIGSERAKVELLIKKYGLEENFYLLGGKSHEEVLQLMQRTKVFLHTSNYEGFGVVCLEALYAGAHVISFCKPMDQEIPRWNIVNSTEEMIKKASEILHDPNIDYKPVMPYTMERSVKAVMGLFFHET